MAARWKITSVPGGIAASGGCVTSPARQVTGKDAAGFGGAARSNSVRPVTGASPSLPSAMRRLASLRPRKPPPPMIVIFMRVLRCQQNSIADGAVHHFAQRLAVEEARQVIDEQLRHDGVAPRMAAADMRQHQDAGRGPERMLG